MLLRAAVVSGTNRQLKPTPWIKMALTMPLAVVSSVKWLIW